MKEKNEENLSLKEVEALLQCLSKPELDEFKKSAIKKRVLNRLGGPVVSYIRSLVSNFSLDSSKRAAIKERVFALIEIRSQKRFVFSNIWRFQKKFVSVAVMFCLVFYIFAFINVDTNVVMAQTYTKIDSFSGEVYLQRDDEYIEVYEGMRLFEKDKIVTGSDGFVEVEFFDDSISRMAENSELVVNKLFRPAKSSVKSYVEVSLEEGSLWSRVVNIVENQSSFVVEANNVYATAKKAAFNVEVSEDEVEVEVYKNVVDVHTTDSNEKVVSGHKAVLDKENNQVGVEVIDDSERMVAWVQENLNEDREYLIKVEERLLAAKLDTLGIEEDEEVYVGSSIKDDVVVFLTFDDVKKKKKELDIAEKNFIASELLLREGGELSDKDITDIENAFNDYSKSVKEFHKLVDEVRSTDDEYADELEVYIEEKVLIQKKNLNLVLPDSPSYKAKKVIEDLELLSADDDEEYIKLKEDQRLSKLSEAEDIVESGNIDLAVKAIKGYNEDYKDVEKYIDSVDESEVVLREKIIEDVVGEAKDTQDNKEEIIREGSRDYNIEVEVEIGEDFVFGKAISDVLDENRNDVYELEEEDISEPDIIEEYGIRIEGDKPLSPLLNF